MSKNPIGNQSSKAAFSAVEEALGLDMLGADAAPLEAETAQPQPAGSRLEMRLPGSDAARSQVQPSSQVQSASPMQSASQASAIEQALEAELTGEPSLNEPSLKLPHVSAAQTVSTSPDTLALPTPSAATLKLPETNNTEKLIAPEARKQLTCLLLAGLWSDQLFSVVGLRQLESGRAWRGQSENVRAGRDSLSGRDMWQLQAWFV